MGVMMGNFSLLRKICSVISRRILDGVRCDYHLSFFVGETKIIDGKTVNTFWEVSTEIACADIYTGVSSVQILPQLVDRNTHAFAEPRGQGGRCNPFVETFICDIRIDDEAFEEKVFDTMESLYRSVLLQLPIYELRSMIDTLHLYLSHAPDLTATLQRIPVERPPAGPGILVLPLSGLCLTVQERSSMVITTSSCCCCAQARIDSGWSTRVLRSRMILKPPPG